MAAVRLACTWELDADTLAAARDLVLGVFAPDIEPEDWDPAVGGVLVMIEEDGAVFGHAAVVLRRLVDGGRALRCGYVEGVAVRGDARRRGYGAALMTAVGEVLRGGYELGALGATDAAVRLYERHGWARWRGPLSALTPDGIRPTPDEQGAVFVLPISVPLELDEPLTCDWRDGDVW
jgi:aminoglycoside 2'-N-acetyltransferase I